MELQDWIGQALTGPLHLRFVVQPVIALVLGVRDGVRDEREGAAPFVLELFARREGLGRRLRIALRQIALPLALAVVLDSVVQRSLRGAIDVSSALWVGALLIALPYTCARGLTNRAMHLRHRRPTGP